MAGPACSSRRVFVETPQGSTMFTSARSPRRSSSRTLPIRSDPLPCSKGLTGPPRDYILHLNDETEERLESGSLVVSDENVMYCTVKGGTERARFLRAAYYQICAKLEYNETDDRYWLPCRDREIIIQRDGTANS